ncbi:MAG: amino acid ABC transporter permease [Candidatus Promineifilaceae bacterium]|nr:amino acid ABC transporter permease [Candidatus Promineifilaceae bacterium]
MTGPEIQTQQDPHWSSNWREFPWWLIAILVFLAIMSILIYTNPDYQEAFVFIIPGLQVTLYTTLVAFAIALVIGLIAGLGSVSNNTAIRNIAVTYVEFIRGVPTLVLIFTLAFVIVPAAVDAVNIDNKVVSNNTRAIIALAVIYGAFLAEIFRAGIESISKGQMEAARSLGMSYRQAMQFIILPQAVRNISPALGNDFIAMLKDSSLVSVLAVRDITQRSRLYAGSTFRFRESYLVLTFLYLSMTIALSLLLRWYERRIGKGRR